MAYTKLGTLTPLLSPTMVEPQKSNKKCIFDQNVKMQKDE